MSGDQEASKPPPLHQYITLPFALHIDPLPSLHYQAVPRSDGDADTPNDDPDAGETDTDSLALEQPHRSSIGNNLRLQPLVIQPPPHDLDTISLLLQHSRATEAVPHFAGLLRLLAEADEDVHFANLIEWFEVRYELGSGRLVGDDAAQVPMAQDRRPGRIARMVSRGHRRSSSNAGSSTNGSGRPSFSLGQSGQILSPTAESAGDDMTALQEGFQQLDFSQGAGPPRTAPQLTVGTRSVTFPIRLDLHNAGRGLCPPPPPPPVVQPPAPAHLKASSSRRSGSDASGLRRILSPSSDRSSNDGGGSNSGFGSIDERVGADRSPRRRSSTLSRLLSRRKSRKRDASNGSATSGGGTASGDVEPAPTPIAEDPSDSALEEDGEGSTTYDPVFLSSDEGHGSGVARDANEWAGSATDSPDFLTLLRSAAETALSLPTTPATLPSAKAKGKRAEPSPSPSSGGGDGSIFSRLARGEAVDEEEEPWYLSGGSDPLPVAILSSLAPAFGWDGVMNLCYGSGSPGHESKQLRALGMAAEQQAQAERAPTGLVGAAAGEGKGEKAQGETRTFADWQRLLDSLSRWVELYEMTRIRAGLAREIGLDALPDDETQLSTTTSSAPGIPPTVTQDALTLTHSYRRRMGIPEGLPATPSAEGLIEPATYRWSRHKLGSASVATATTLTAASLAHYFTAMATRDFVWQAGWELDYLEALVLKTPIIAQRFPPPLSRAVTTVSSPREGGASLRPLSCPNPRPDGSVDVEAWRVWLAEQVDAGCVVTPAVSHQAWWTVIALLNDGGERERGLGLQILGAYEDWREVRRLEGEEGERSVYV